MERQSERSKMATMAGIVAYNPELAQNLFALKLYALICSRHSYGWIA